MPDITRWGNGRLDPAPKGRLRRQHTDLEGRKSMEVSKINGYAEIGEAAAHAVGDVTRACLQTQWELSKMLELAVGTDPAARGEYGVLAQRATMALAKVIDKTAREVT